MKMNKVTYIGNFEKIVLLLQQQDIQRSATRVRDKENIIITSANNNVNSIF